MVHAAASCVLGPVIAALSLTLVGHAALGARLGRNARFASLGNGFAAAAMGACGYLFSPQAVFFLTAGLAAPAIVVLVQIRISRRDDEAGGALGKSQMGSWQSAFCNRRLLTFAGCILLFQLANAAMLPLMGSVLTLRSGELASTLVGACIVIPQLIVALAAPSVGRLADEWGRRPLLYLSFVALAVRGAIFALTSSPYLVLMAQALDGICAAVLGVLLPLVVADIMRGTGRFNLGLGIVGSAIGIGAALSTTLAGYTMDHFGSGTAFVGLACIGLCGAALVCLLPETRPQSAGRAAAAFT
jgi:predicted MFS family arabinose efflux permease